jgi:hypothetical protein
MSDLSANTRRIGDISNAYGQLEVKQEGGRFFWDIENYDGHYWEEIPKYLFLALNRFQDEKEQAAQKPANT